MIRVMAVPQERGTPAWSVRLAADLDANDQAAKKLVAELTEEQLNWQPARGSWSVGQCLEHLCITNEAYLPPISVAVSKKPDFPVEQITPGWFGRWFIRSFIEPSPVTRELRLHRRLGPRRTLVLPFSNAFSPETNPAGNSWSARAPKTSTAFAFGIRLSREFDSPSVPDSRSLSAMNAVISFKPSASCISPASLTSSHKVGMERPPARQYGCSGVKDQCAAQGRQNAGLGARDPILLPL